MHYPSAPAWSFQGKSAQKNYESSPGPGLYNPRENHHSSSPSFKIGTSQKIENSSNATPGPGTYKTQVRDSSPKYTLSKSPRSQIRINPTPGPGSYENRISLKTPGGIIGRSSKSLWTQSVDTPGPGNYNLPSKAIEGPKYTITGGKTNRSIESSPGPGAYSYSYENELYIISCIL